MKVYEMIEELKQLSVGRETMPVKVADDGNGTYVKTVFVDSYIDPDDGEEVYYIKIVPYNKEQEPERVTFEQAEMLAQLFSYRKKCTYFYHVKTQLIDECKEPMNHNVARTWAGVNGWHYSRYSAPTKDEAIEFLSELVMDISSNAI